MKRVLRVKSKKIKLYHVSNPLFRYPILINGLKPMVGVSYSTQWATSNERRIFFSLDDDYDSTYDDDRYTVEIPANLVPLYIDTEMCDSRSSGYVYTNRSIPRKYITLHHKGTGISTF